jgi:hypothetical protein
MTSCLIWILTASLLGFTVASVFSGWLRLQRNVYLLLYIPLVAALFTAFVISNDLNIKEIFLYNWTWGILGAVLAGAFVVKNVVSQPSSERHHGISLLSDILWPGFTYGLIDALLLSVLPVLVVRLAITNVGTLDSWSENILFIVLSLLASFFVTTAYHLGYPEFRGKNVIWPNIGNGVLTLAYLLTMNPLAAILPHITMHIVAMLHGPKTTGQVPPHYKN